MAFYMGQKTDPKLLDRMERAVLTHMLRCEPDAALASQLACAGLIRREFYGPHQISYFTLLPGALPAQRNTTVGGYTYAKLVGHRSPAAFTLHLDESGWMSHLIAFMDDDSPWPEEITGFEVFSTKASVPPPAYSEEDLSTGG
jgi:hypothetical protein